MNAKFSSLFFLVAVLIVAFAGGFFLGIQQKVSPQQESSFRLPVAPEILTNPLVGEWQGSAEGTIIEKNDDNLVLGDEAGNVLRIYRTYPTGQYAANVFVREGSATGSSASLSYDEIQVGSRARVQFSLSPSPKIGKDRPLLSYLKILKEKE